jgi:hypothetical protein
MYALKTENKMVTKSGELRTYYQRDWETILPKLPLWEIAGHVAGLALPFVGLLYQPAGKAISYGSTALNALVIGKELYKANESTIYTRSSISKDGWRTIRLWSVIKNGAEFIGTIASLRIGLAVHTVMNLGEKSYKLLDKFRLSTWSKTGERMLPIVSNALYLLTLVSFSAPVSYGIIGASLVFQAGLSFHKAYNTYEKAWPWNQREQLETAVYGAMTVVFLAKAGIAILQRRESLDAIQLQNAVKGIFD